MRQLLLYLVFCAFYVQNETFQLLGLNQIGDTTQYLKVTV